MDFFQQPAKRRGRLYGSGGLWQGEPFFRAIGRERGYGGGFRKFCDERQRPLDWPKLLASKHDQPVGARLVPGNQFRRLSTCHRFYQFHHQLCPEVLPRSGVLAAKARTLPSASLCDSREWNTRTVDSNLPLSSFGDG